MALMKILINDCKTDGERLVFIFFRDYLSNDFIIWSNIELNVFSGKDYSSTEIDFIIFHKRFGLFILSVKDWRINQISQIDQKYITVNNKKQNNPFINCKKQLYTLKERLQQKYELKNYENQIMSPINIAIVFPFIDSKEWKDKLNKFYYTDPSDIIPENVILFKHMFEDGSLLKDKNRIISYFENIRVKNIRFPCKFEDTHIEILDRIFGVEEGYIEPPETSVIGLLDDEYFIELDNKQRAIANNYLERMYKNPGPLLIKGIAGSGKTIILLHLFSQIARDPEMTILYVARQRELVLDFKRKLENIGIPTENPNFTIEVFFQLFRNFCDPLDLLLLEKDKSSPFPSEIATSSYISNHLSDITEKYDFVFIDEGHNLPDEWLKFLIYSCKNKERGNIVYVEDFEQNIYQIRRDFKKVGLAIDENIFELLISYRNTYQIAYFACQLTDKYKKLIASELKNLRQGSIPEVIFDNDYDRVVNAVNKKIGDWLEDKFSLDEIAIIYPNLKRGPNGFNIQDDLLLGIIKRVYEISGLKFSIHYPAHRITNMFGLEFEDIILSRRDEDGIVNKEAIKLITSYSSQGISYKCVIVIMDNFEDQRWQKLKKNLAYITLTRATHNLLLVFSEKNDTYEKTINIIDCMNRGISY